MRKIQLNFWIFGLLAAICCFAVTSAQAVRDPVPLKPVPEMMRGIWAAPDCFAPEEWHFYSAYFRFETAGGGITMSSAATLQNKEDYDVIGFNSPRGTYMPARVLEDGVLQMVRLENGARPAANWDALDVASYQEYMHCLDTALPAGMEEVMRRTTALDAVYPACRNTLDRPCLEAVFRVWMPASFSGENPALRREDIERILSDAAFFSALGKDRNDTTHSSSAVAALSIIVTETFDRDRNGSASVTLARLRHGG